MKGVAVPIMPHALHVIIENTTNVKGVAVPVALHVVLQGTLRDVNRAAVRIVRHVALHVVQQGTLRNVNSCSTTLGFRV